MLLQLISLVIYLFCFLNDVHGQSDKFTTAKPLLEIDVDKFGVIHPVRMDFGPDKLLYFTSSLDASIFRTDSKGNYEVFAKVIDGSAAGWTCGCQFDDKGNFYMVNGRGVYKISSDVFLDKKKASSLPVALKLFFEWPEGTIAAPISIGIDSKGIAYVSDMIAGTIWKIDTNTGVGAVWANGSNSAYEDLLGAPNSTNFLGAPTGIDEVMPDKMGKWLYFVNFERNFFGRIQIKDDGSAGALQKLATNAGVAIGGAFLDTRNNVIYGAGEFTNFPNGVEREPKAAAGGQVWMLDLNTIDDDGKGGKAEMILQDKNYGTVVDVITGYGFGNEEDIYVLDASLDTFQWPTGVIPDPNATHHAAVRVLKGKAKSSDGEL